MVVCKRATTNQITKYKLALSLFKLYNTDFNSIEFSLLNDNQVFTSRQTNFITLKSNRSIISLNWLIDVMERSQVGQGMLDFVEDLR